MITYQQAKDQRIKNIYTTDHKRGIILFRLNWETNEVYDGSGARFNIFIDDLFAVKNSIYFTNPVAAAKYFYPEKKKSGFGSQKQCELEKVKYVYTGDDAGGIVCHKLDWRNYDVSEGNGERLYISIDTFFNSYAEPFFFNCIEAATFQKSLELAV